MVAYIRNVKGRTDLVVLDQEVGCLSVNGRVSAVAVTSHCSYFCSQLPGDVLRTHVRVAIEVKPQSVFKSSSSGCMREAVIQLIGLNANNPYRFGTTLHSILPPSPFLTFGWCVRSPAVILTNLLETHRVIFINHESDDPLQYSLKERCFKNFNHALHFAMEMGIFGKGHTLQFARPPTPISEEW